MDKLIEMLDIEPMLKWGGIKNRRRNFEDSYSELYENDPSSPLLREIEKIVYAYFENLSLPKFPTMYDHLLLSLRPKGYCCNF